MQHATYNTLDPGWASYSMAPVMQPVYPHMSLHNHSGGNCNVHSNSSTDNNRDSTHI